jgi:hypothetical protein
MCKSSASTNNTVKSIGFDGIILIISSLFVIASYVYYLYHAKDFLNSDIATEILNGKEMFDRKSIFLTEWYFSTEIFLIRTPFFIALWLFITDSLIGAYILAVTTEIILQTMCFIYMGRRFEFSWKAILLGILVFFGIRTLDTGYYCGIVTSTYATIYMLCFMVLGYYAAQTKGNVKVIDRIVSVLILILAFAFGITSARVLTILFFPLLMYYCIHKIWSTEPLILKNDRILPQMAIWLVVSLVGIIIAEQIIKPLGFGPALYQSKSTLGLVYAFQILLPTLLTEFFHYNPLFPIMEETNIFNFLAINGLLCLVFYIIFLYCIKMMWKKNDKLRITTIGFLLTSLIFLVLVQLILFIKATIQIRYYLYMFVLFAVVFSYVYEDLKHNHVKRMGIVIFMGVFLTTNSISNIIQLPIRLAYNISRVSVWHADEIAKIMEKYGIKLGYALYWDSSNISVLTDCKVEIAGVYGNLKPIRYVSPYRYYKPDLENEKTVFIKINQPIFDEYKNHPTFKLENIWIFDKAVAKEVIKGSFYDIEILIFDHNYFVFPQGHNPKDDYVPQLDSLEYISDILKY